MDLIARRPNRHTLSAAAAAALVALTVAAIGAAPAGAAPRATIAGGGVVRGAAVPGGDVFRGLPYAAAPVGNLRWRAPRPPAAWRGVRDATQFGPSCPQAPSLFAPPGPQSEDCLYLNVVTPTLRHRAHLPVLVWIHGGGLTQDGARNYDGSKLAAAGAVVVTINYRLGALGFLAHPALASRPGGPAGNYGLMDQQAALRWVQRNIARFGGDPHDVTLAGQSAGGLSVLAHLVSHGSRGLFQRAIVQSGAFALTQQPLADAEAAGQAFAAKAGCPDQTARCLRRLPIAALVRSRTPRSRASSTAPCCTSRSERRWPPAGSPACRSSTASTTTRSGSSSPGFGWPSAAAGSCRRPRRPPTPTRA